MGINYGRDLKGIAFVKRPGVTTYTSGGGHKPVMSLIQEKIYIYVYKLGPVIPNE